MGGEAHDGSWRETLTVPNINPEPTHSDSTPNSPTGPGSLQQSENNEDDDIVDDDDPFPAN